MRSSILTFSALLAGLTVSGANQVWSQDYPSKPIRMVTSEAGGGGDVIARIIAQGLSAGFGRQVIVENRGIIGAEVVARARPDGYTLLFYGSNVWISPLLRKTSWDPIKDFSPVTLAVSAINILVVHPSVPATSVKELIALAKANPGKLNFASSAVGSSTHLSGELFKAMAGIDIVHVPYKGVAPAFNDLLGGRVQMIFSNSASMAPYVKAGRLRALAVGSAKPSSLLPDLPTVAETVPGFEAPVPYAIFVPANTPVPLINRLNQEITRVLNDPDVKARLVKTEVEVYASSPEQLAAMIKAEIVRWGKVIKDAGIHDE